MSEPVTDGDAELTFLRAMAAGPELLPPPALARVSLRPIVPVMPPVFAAPPPLPVPSAAPSAVLVGGKPAGLPVGAIAPTLDEPSAGSQLRRSARERTKTVAFNIGSVTGLRVQHCLSCHLFLRLRPHCPSNRLLQARCWWVVSRRVCLLGRLRPLLTNRLLALSCAARRAMLSPWSSRITSGTVRLLSATLRARLGSSAPCG